ncbi:type IV pilus twitching motility protein PilT [Anaerosalibacter bizertensis]|uniref:Type IV pilus twitching motility protein PilT n=1 Tax=Anaerosalibacter bizertensis TaxID=932217 RepID=A0A9Q4AAV3_9FIRM|nr:type IV pilus twitching motility protein PilT [Anaerosalibacter bizertensis]MBV1818182.1 type IV pilus twitching motility protein PilT [Bacteroidales bacterium MSK.15.36]MCB5558446.1 type IV pilus twitching motility protein PilT [Anaerosalibacter bizertensis]MCG4564210.1 type IV pilus twitching motility protein PilT [Anaerosalibacter bizertensis]MCG4582117.1 type IV pilus twitching motility protein PilT [Anaerosalibacter bizertensis]MCG4584531.1 type IV pilus twitching motility protein PilT
MEFIELVTKAVKMKASDLHLVVGVPPVFRINGSLVKCGEDELKSNDIGKIVEEVLNKDQLRELNEKGEVDIAYSMADRRRLRVNVFRQRGCLSLSLRIIPKDIPTLEELKLPNIVKGLTKLSRGLILVTGPTGSGKTTTLASMINEINEERNCHIITLEDPIEYVHIHNQSIINQREIKNDTLSFSKGLRAALRQDPDVILVGEMRDLETISTVLTAAETGHLVISTLHTLGAAKTMDRIIDVFPPEQQRQIKVQLASVIQGIISQQLLKSIDGNSRFAAFEIMIATPAIRNLIREGKNYQIDTVIQTGKKHGMQTMDNAILNLYNKRLISKEIALSGSINKDMLSKYL